MSLRLGTRASPLARWQAEWVAGQLQTHGIAVELVLLTTRGDSQQQGPIGAIQGGQGVFTKELQRALLDGRIDLAVHSLKDLPTERVAGLGLASVPEREACGDILIGANGVHFADLPRGAVVGTGSFRRRAQLLHARPDLVMQDIRGNVDTRLKKVSEGQFAAIILAEAGITRLGLRAHITEFLPKSLILPAVGQGALGLETRTDDAMTQSAVAKLNDPQTHQAVLAERAMLFTLRGGCLAPVGAWGRIENEQLTLSGVVLSRDGARRLYHEESAAAAAAEALGQRVAENLLAQGAADLIAESRQGE